MNFEPCLCTGITEAILNLSGTVLVENEQLNMSARDKDI